MLYPRVKPIVLAVRLTDSCGKDDVLITKDGYENLTTAPKDVGEMVGIINGQKSLLERLRLFDMT